MNGIADAYSDLIDRVDTSATLSARSGRFVALYQAKAYKLATETTDEGNVRVLAEALAVPKSYDQNMDKVRARVPEQTSIINAAITAVHAAFNICEPILHQEATSTTTQANAEDAKHLKEQCDPPLETASQAQFALTDALIAYAAKASDALTDRTNGTIWIVLTSVGAGLVVSIAVALWVGLQGLSRPIGSLNAAMEALARNDLTAEIPGSGRGDEVGAMARTVAVFKTSALEVAQLRAGQEAEQQRQIERGKKIETTVIQFESDVRGIVQGVSSAATELQSTATSMASTAEQTTRQSSTVAAASEEATQNVQTVAAATEQLSASIREISQQLSQATRVIAEGVQQATQSSAQMRGLTTASERIGDVVKIISDIAGQTNLLALNATIEAARAGDAGKGFAVVASEVKALATQTSKATGDIADQIKAIQEATQISAQSIQSVTETISKVSETATAIASAIEQQGAATQEISRNVLQAARGTQEVSGNIVGVSHAAQQTGSAATQVLSAAAELSRNGEALQMQVEAFLREVRVA
jgi:methyl-accepting chemotaxis protein